jgi:hypothetical protein
VFVLFAVAMLAGFRFVTETVIQRAEAATEPTR